MWLSNMEKRVKYVVCSQEEVIGLKEYLYKNKEDIVPSAIEQMYGNDTATAARLKHGMEVAVAAVDEENNEIQGVVSAISPNVDSNWTIVALHVKENARRQRIATNLLETFKNTMVEKWGAVKCAASIMNSNKQAGACLLINGFEFEGKLSAVDKEKEMAVYGNVFVRR